MARTKKKTQNLQDAKAAALNPLEDQPKRRLTLLLPKKPNSVSPKPESEKNPSDFEEITPPPPVSQKVVKDALNTYLRARGRSVPMEDEDDESETELLMREKRRTFQGGIEDIGDDSGDGSVSVDAGIEEDEDEDELQSDEDDEEEDSAAEMQGADSPTTEQSPTPVPEVKKKKRKALPPAEELASPAHEGKKKKKKAAPASLKISVPVDGANITVTVKCTLPFQDLLTQLANTMCVAPNKVRVAYRFSTQLRNAAFNHLATKDHWKELVAAAKHTQETSRSQKDFIVELKDLLAAGAKGKAAKGGEKGGKKKRKYESDSEDVSDTGSEGDRKKGKSKKLSGPQWVAKLEASNACKEHGVPCIKYASGHIQLSKTDLTTWSVFMINGYQSETTPPPRLKIGKQKDVETSGPAAPALPVAPAVNPLMPAMPYGVPPFNPWWTTAYQTPVPPPRARYEDIPSSDPVEDVEDVTLFPRIMTWLQGLDDGPRGRDGHDFSQFAPEFERQKYMRVVDLIDLNISHLTTLMPDMAHGTASKLLSYAVQDVEKIRRKEKKRARRDNPNHYP
ncbi:hypothetical protein B0H19DRAFT_1247341 [Mycena capillaripes]|nr:hypothetical protein B0H19DRAFT_1247341 [Mycena capillaripes]